MSNEELLDRALEKVLADRSPRSELAGLSDEELRMVRMAQLLRGSRGQAVDPGFADSLRTRLVRPRVISRRTAFLSGLGALAAGVVAGVGVDRAVQNSPSSRQEPLVTANGRWFPVATVAEVPEGSIRPFTAGAVQGFLIHRNGQLRALSRICTHMGCALAIDRAEQTFTCPCHGAEFDFQGRIHNAEKYGRVLPPLPAIETRVRGNVVEVFGA